MIANDIKNYIDYQVVNNTKVYINIIKDQKIRYIKVNNNNNIDYKLAFRCKGSVNKENPSQDGAQSVIEAYDRTMHLIYENIL